MSELKSFLYEVQQSIDSTKNKELNSAYSERKNVVNLKIVVGVDVSGSISLEQFQQFLARIDLIRGLSVIKILETDDEIVALYDYHIGQHEVMRLQGGGGTDFTKAFDLAKKMNPDLILFLTDGMVAPGHVEDPGIPTGWILCHNSENKAPYGFGRVLEVLPELNNN